MSQPNGYVLWEGPSLLDGAPIVMIGTGYVNKSMNSKTGGMIQTWILRSDMPPVEAVKTGADASICGDCVLRGNGNGKERGCYVNVFWAPGRVYDGFQRGIYPGASAPGNLCALHRNRVVRLGAYGDPAAVPPEVLAKIVSGATSWTGYTHQWRTADLQRLCMASVETGEQAEEAHVRGYRTFRTLGGVEDRHAKEILCPASEEAGHRTTCEKCTLCSGSQTTGGLDLVDPRKHIAIVVHGAGEKWAARAVAA